MVVRGPTPPVNACCGRADARSVPLRRLLPVACVLMLLGPSSASAFRLGGPLDRVLANPVERLSALPMDDERYDPATHCDPKGKPGTKKLVRWLQANQPGEFWGSYRCEKWGPHEASLHAEGRAVDWHLDGSTATGRREARRLIELLLAPDSTGTPHALARRMGVEEIIWDCSYWGAGSDDFGRLSVCYSKRGVVKRRVDPTTAHRDHVHLGLSKRGAAALTSFWTRRAAG